MGDGESLLGLEVQGWITLGDLELPVSVWLTAVRPYLEGRLVFDRTFARGTLVPLCLEDGRRALLTMTGDPSNRFVGMGRLTRGPRPHGGANP